MAKCKKCGKELLVYDKGNYCAICKQVRKENTLKVLGGVGAAALAVAAIPAAILFHGGNNNNNS